jgi:hypothetical protein
MVSWSNPYDRDLQIISTRRASYLTAAILFLRHYDGDDYEYILNILHHSGHINEDLQGLQIDHRCLNLFFTLPIQTPQ